MHDRPCRGIVAAMEQRLIIHIVDSSSRTRAELSRMAFELGHHAEVYADLAELAAHPPRDGLVLARDLPEAGGAGAVLEDLAEAGIWLPLVAFGCAAFIADGDRFDQFNTTPRMEQLCFWLPLVCASATYTLRRGKPARHD